MPSRFLACLLILTLACPSFWASPGPDQKHIDAMRKKVADCIDKQRRVVIETYDGRRLLPQVRDRQSTDSIR